MQIVSDRGMDLSPEQMQGLTIHLVPLIIQLDGKSYVSGEDVQPDEFYKLLVSAEGLPTTSLPSPGEFASLYRELARTDPDILSVHISSGLSGTVNAAREGAKLVPEANVTIFDTFTLSGAQGWQVEAAARAAKAGWPLDKILSTLERVRDLTETIYTLPDLKYLIHGGRISHIKGLLASVLRIKPLIGVSKEDGRYYQRGQVRTLDRAFGKIVDIIAEKYTGRVTVGKCNVEENQKAASSLNIQSIPTLILYNKGEMVEHFVGVTSEDVLSEIIDFELE